MSCVVLKCKSRSGRRENGTELITYHRFPNNKIARERWIKNISRKNWTWKKECRICSKHFTDDCFKNKALLKRCRIKPGAVPTLHLGHDLTPPMELIKEESEVSEVAACLACLATDCRLYDVTECGLQEAFDNLAGAPVSTLNGFSNLCLLCSVELSKYAAFRDRCQRVHELLATLQKWGALKMDDIRAIDRDSHKLTRNLTKTGVEILDNTETGSFLSTPIKTEEGDTDNDSMCVDTNIKELNEESEDSYEIISIKLKEIEDTEMDEVIVKQENEPTTLEKRKDCKVSAKGTVDTVNIEDLEKQEMEPTTLEKRNDSEVSAKATKIDSNNIEDLEKQEKKPNTLKKRKSLGTSKVSTKASKTDTTKTKKDVSRLKIKVGDDFYPDYNYKALENKYNVKITLLSKDEQKAEVEARKLTSNYLWSPHRCELCGKGYNHLNTLTNHMSHHDHSVGPFECEICRFRFATRRQHANHRATHRLKFTCQLCGFVTRTNNYARQHFAMHSGKTYACPHCPRVFAKMTSRYSHARILHPEKHVSCDQCGETFLSAYGVKMHKDRAHRENIKQQDFKCPSCVVNFNSSEALDKHTSTAPDCHTAVTPCAECGENCESAAALSEHTALRHPPDQYRCHECDATFPSSVSLDTHHRRKHLGLPPKTQKLPAYTKFQYKNKKIVDRKSVVCEICGKLMQNEAILKFHRKVHDSARPFKCTHCPKTFVFKHTRNWHERSHTGERPFLCELCPAAFAQNGNLKRHHKTNHLNQRPSVPCPLCDKMLSAKAYVKRHIDTVHNNMPWPKRKRRRKEVNKNNSAEVSNVKS